MWVTVKFGPECGVTSSVSLGAARRLLSTTLVGVDAASVAFGVEGVAVRYGQIRSLMTQFRHSGCVSSHLICRFLHSLQPFLDFRWARRPESLLRCCFGICRGAQRAADRVSYEPVREYTDDPYEKLKT